jgi:hypothetical protein
MMPPQLARAKRPKRTTPRPIVETLPRVDIADLCRWNVFPSQCDWHKAHLLELPFRYPFLKNPVISLENIEANHHSDCTQYIPLRWIRTGFGGLAGHARCSSAPIAAAQSPSCISRAAISIAGDASTLSMRAKPVASACDQY